MPIKKFSQSAFGSFIKITWTALLGQIPIALIFAYSTNSDIFSWDEGVWKGIIGSLIGAVILVWKNWKDPSFPIYGNKPKEEILVDNPEVNQPQ